MDREIEVFVLQLLRQHNILTLATAREDGWPQATTVGYVNDGLTLYVGCGADSQKVRNIKRSNKVSLTTRRTGARSRGSRWAPRPRSSLIRRRSPTLAS